MIEAERAAIAAEIHDGLLPYLYAAAAKLSAIRRSRSTAAGQATSGPVDERLDERLADASQWIDQSREVARALMSGITYPPLALSDPLAAAQAFVEQFVEQIVDVADTELAGNSPISTVSWSWGDGSSPLADRLAPETSIAVFRLTTEFVRNALRHAQAGRIDVSAVIADATAIVQIQDNGCGFDLRCIESSASSSHGITMARHRAEAGGIELQIESSHESDDQTKTGTRVTLRAASSSSSPPQEQIQPQQQAPR